MSKFLKFLILKIFSIVAGFLIYAEILKLFFDTSGYQEIIIYTKDIIILMINGQQDRINIKALFCFYIGIFGAILFLILSLLTFFKKSKKNNYGKAKFASIKNLKELDLNTKKGIWFGNIGKTPIKADLPLSALIISPPGTGKSAGIVIPTLLTMRNSCVVLDIKGEMEEITSKFRRKVFNQEILIFNPFGIKIKSKNDDEKTSKEIDFNDHNLFFNPFDKELIKDLSFAELSQLVAQIANTIFVVNPKADDHWRASAKNLFTFFALNAIVRKGTTTFFEIAQAPQKDYFDEIEDDFKEMVSEFNNEHNKWIKNPTADTFLAYLTQISTSENVGFLHNGTTQEEYEILKNNARRYKLSLSKGGEEFASIISTFSTYMDIFSDPRVKEATCKNTIFPKNLREKNQTLYIKVRQDDMDTLGALIRVIIEFIAKNLCSGESINSGETDKYVYFLLDEFVRFGKMEYILRMPELSRSYGVIPVFISQSYEQFELVYSKEHLGILLSTTHYQATFRLNSLKDAKLWSDTIGNFTREKESFSKKSGVMKKDTSTSVSQEGYSLLTAQDIMGQKDKITLVVSGGKDKPLQLDINFWFKNKDLKQEYDKVMKS